MTATAIPPQPVEAWPAAPAAQRGWMKTVAMIAIIVLVTGIAFWRVWLGSLPIPVVGNQPFDFVDWDDPKTIAGNPDFNPPTTAGLARYWKEPYLDLYIPVTYTVWHIVARIAELPLPDDRGIAHDPYPFHAANLLAHILSAVLVFGILRMLVPLEWAAFVGALVFALHPVQVEAVAWVSGFKDALSGLFSLAAIWQYLLYATRRQAAEEDRAWQVPYVVATIFFLLAMLSKPSAVTVPIIVGVIDLFLLRRNWADVSGPLWIWLLLALTFLVIGRMAQPATALDFIPPLWARPLIALTAMAFHLYHLFIPVGLAADYSLSPDRLLNELRWITFTVWIIPAALIALCYVYRKRFGWPIVSAGVFAAGLLPVLGLLPFDFQYYSAVADRYLYVALLGPALLVGYILSIHPKPWLVAVTGAAVIVLGVLTYRQTTHWRDTDALFARTLEVNPRSLVAHQMLGNAAVRAGNTELAIKHYKEALITKPTDPETEYNLANVLMNSERSNEALPHYANALKGRPSDPRIHNNYGEALRRLGKLEDASRKFADAWAAAPPTDPLHEIARNNVALTEQEIAAGHAATQNWARAIPHYEAALKADRNMTVAQVGLAEARRRLGSRTQ